MHRVMLFYLIMNRLYYTGKLIYIVYRMFRVFHCGVRALFIKSVRNNHEDNFTEIMNFV